MSTPQILTNMTASTEPAATLSNLHRADGSATYSQNGYTVIGAVNGPIEVQRRDELPEEAAVDVIVRPAAGIGGMWNGRYTYSIADWVKVLVSDISSQSSSQPCVISFSSITSRGP
jgi:hypothetical protein